MVYWFGLIRCLCVFCNSGRLCFGGTCDFAYCLMFISLCSLFCLFRLVVLLLIICHLKWCFVIVLECSSRLLCDFGSLTLFLAGVVGFSVLVLIWRFLGVWCFGVFEWRVELFVVDVKQKFRRIWCFRWISFVWGSFELWGFGSLGLFLSGQVGTWWCFDLFVEFGGLSVWWFGGKLVFGYYKVEI